MTEDNEMFNNSLARLRIFSEHCIGILKGRFPWLRSIRIKITKDKNSIRRILQLIDATVILHNMLIEFGEDEKEDWIDFDDFSEIAMQSPYEENDELNRAIPLWAPKDTRRSQILAYFKEFFHLQISTLININLVVVRYVRIIQILTTDPYEVSSNTPHNFSVDFIYEF